MCRSRRLPLPLLLHLCMPAPRVRLPCPLPACACACIHARTCIHPNTYACCRPSGAPAGPRPRGGGHCGRHPCHGGARQGCAIPCPRHSSRCGGRPLAHRHRDPARRACRVAPPAQPGPVPGLPPAPVSQRPASSGSRHHTFSSQPVSSGSRPLLPTAPGAACGSRRPPRGLGAGQMCPACTFCS